MTACQERLPNFAKFSWNRQVRRSRLTAGAFIYVTSATHSFGGAGPELLDSLSQCGMPEAKPREVVSAGVS